MTVKKYEINLNIEKGGIGSGRKKTKIDNLHTLQLKSPFDKPKTHKDKDGDIIHEIQINANSISEFVNDAKNYEGGEEVLRGDLSSNEGIKTKNGLIFWGSDIQDHL